MLWGILPGKSSLNVVQLNHWQWGPCGRLEKVIEKQGSCQQEETSYFYDRWGQLEKIVKPDGSYITQIFNDQGLLETIYSSDQSIGYAFQYNEQGLPVNVQNLCLTSEMTREYSKEGVLQSETLENGATISYRYDTLGRKTHLILPDNSSISYSYDLAFLKQVQRFNKEGHLQYTHDYVDYDKAGRPISQKMIGDLGEINDTYTSQEKNRKSPFLNETVHCDAQQRIIRKDKLEHREKSSFYYSYNPLSELIEERGTQEISYPPPSNNCVEFDLNGNLIKKLSSGHCYEYQYDALNRMTLCRVDGKVVEEYQYDAYHRRIASIASGKKCNYIYDGNCEIGAQNDQNQLTQLRVMGLMKGSERDATIAVELDDTVYAVLNDTQGSLSQLIDMNGKIAFDCSYSAFGTDTLSQNTSIECPWRFCGKRKDALSGLVFFGRRYLDPELGHWTSKDPLGFIDGAERRTFVHNNPLNAFDHFGLSSVSDDLKQMKNTLKKLIEQAGAKLLHSIRKAREYCSVGLSKTLDHLVGKGFLLLMGYYKTEATQGSYGLGELSDKVRVSYINGILTDYASLYSTLRELSNSHGGVNIHYIYRPTKGWVWDILQSFMVKLGFISPYAHGLAKEWKKMIYEMGGVDGGGTIIHYAHSIGAVETLRALSLLTAEEQKMIEIYAFGSPNLRGSSGAAQLTHFVSVRDGVPLLDPWGFIKACKGGLDYVVFVGTFIGIPFVDHLFNAQAYQDLWRSMGRTFVEWYGTLI
jgi:RHS repeat-associated protein